MSTTRSICKGLGYMIGGGTLVGGLTAGLQAAAGKAGAALMESYNYSGYNNSEAANMGAVGGAIIGGGLGVVSGLFAACGVQPGRAKKSEYIATVASAVLIGMAGYGVLNAGDNSTEMPLGQTCASFAVGASIVLIPLKILLDCMTKDSEPENDAKPSITLSRV